MKHPHWHITRSAPAHQNPYFSVLESEVVVPGGEHRDYYTINFPRPAVGVIACRGDDVLLIHQYRFIVEEYVWAIPSGGVSDSEPLQTAALRELEEETGYTAQSIEPFMHCYASYGCSNQRFEIFLADHIRKLDSDFDRSEVLDTRWFSRAELRALIDKNGIVDNLSLSPLLLFLLRS
ncbi:MAG TPA: NUDIX hydrolase [Bryobacteraceae bacterium]|jgi:8-oxo-dGTP pyrophosphatase MutT (NUDIX family)